MLSRAPNVILVNSIAAELIRPGLLKFSNQKQINAENSIYPNLQQTRSFEILQQSPFNQFNIQQLLQITQPQLDQPQVYIHQQIEQQSSGDQDLSPKIRTIDSRIEPKKEFLTSRLRLKKFIKKKFLDRLQRGGRAKLNKSYGSTQSLYLQCDQQRNPDISARKEAQIVQTSIQQRLTIQTPPNTENKGAWPVRSQAQLEQERVQEKRTVSIIELQQRLRAAEQEDRDLNQEENPISHQGQLRERKENRQRQSDQYWKASDPDQQVLDRAIALTRRISDYAAQTDDQNPIYYHDNTIQEQIIETGKEVSALEARNKHRRDNLDKENETRTLEKERIELTRTLRKDYIDSNPTLQVDRKNPRSPCLPSYIEQSIALEVDERPPLLNQVNNMQDPMLINTTISPLRINFNQDSSSKINFTYPQPELANNNQLSFFEQQVINNRNRAHQPLQQMEPINPVQHNSPQIQYQIRQVDPQEEEDLDKQILQLREERDILQLRFEQEVHDTVFGDIDCPSDLNNDEMDKQSQSEDSEEAKDPQSIQDEKGKHMEMYKLDGNENVAKVKVSLINEKQYKNHMKMDKQSQSDDSQEFGITSAKKNRGKHKRGKKTKVEQPRKERNLNKMNEDQTRNLRSGTKFNAVLCYYTNSLLILSSKRGKCPLSLSPNYVLIFGDGGERSQLTSICFQWVQCLSMSIPLQVISAIVYITYLFSVCSY
ncbi:MAG: hypothetical protein EZS28_029530 [Streblomastix strix]|uniref:Uncharacterized protein n=1 Tax=Streblomastix strix TaxID=222440 RepID=A0A5J4UXK1_9EUKA|nr:MAG: hypothetical protein EZS28_029530 [Streblomastix strix]